MNSDDLLSDAAASSEVLLSAAVDILLHTLHFFTCNFQPNMQLRLHRSFFLALSKCFDFCFSFWVHNCLFVLHFVNLLSDLGTKYFPFFGITEGISMKKKRGGGTINNCCYLWILHRNFLASVAVGFQPSTWQKRSFLVEHVTNAWTNMASVFKSNRLKKKKSSVLNEPTGSFLLDITESSTCLRRYLN